MENTVSSVAGDDIVPFFKEFLLIKQSDGRIVVYDENPFHSSHLLSNGDGSVDDRGSTLVQYFFLN
jgi:hypothetical protein